MCLKQQLKFQIANVLEEEDNAVCPKCLDHWDFDEDYAWYHMSQQGREQLVEQKYLHVVCEDCERSEDIEEFLELMAVEDIYVTFSSLSED